jgi:hypothetical protein
MASKYDPLTRELRASPTLAEWDFAAIGRLVGGLPRSAYEYREWWANSRRNPQGRAWLAAGRKVDLVDLLAGQVRFTTGAIQVERGRGRGRPPARLGAAEGRATAALPDAIRLPASLEVAVEGVWRSVGSVTVSAEGGLVFPALPSVPGCYRLIWTSPDGVLRVYVGESVDLRRRMRNYERPGVSQRTSLRVNALLADGLRNGDTVEVEMLDAAGLLISGERRPVDLSAKADRVLVEHAALVAVRGSGVEVHNL